MWHMYKCALKHPFGQDGLDRLNNKYGLTITIFLDRQFFTIPN